MHRRSRSASPSSSTSSTRSRRAPSSSERQTVRFDKLRTVVPPTLPDGPKALQQWYPADVNATASRALAKAPGTTITVPPPLVAPAACELARARAVGYSPHGYDAFIIHHGRDKRGAADALYSALQGPEHGINTFLDFRSLPVGLNAQMMIAAALSTCRVAIVVCGAATHRSAYVVAEVALALRRSQADARFAVVPVFLDDFDLDGIQCGKWDCPVLSELTDVTGIVQRQRPMSEVIQAVCVDVARYCSRLGDPPSTTP